MLTLKARYFVDMGTHFHDLLALYYGVSGEDRELAANELGAIQQHFEQVYQLCLELKLLTSKSLIETRLDHKTLPRSVEAFEMLRDAVYAELQDKWFAYIPVDRLEYFDTDMISSFQVRDRFPQASYEIRNAGTCYAMGLPTASVFHAMRACELGVQLLGTSLGVTFSYPIELAEWGKIIGEIEEKIQAFKGGQRSKERDENLRFYSEAAAQFRHFNNGWRVRNAHARVTYEDEQAKKVLDHVRDFFETLSERLEEPQ